MQHKLSFATGILKAAFLALDTDRIRAYSPGQREIVFKLVSKNGIRPTSRILKLPRRTIQRWKNEGKHER